VLNIQTDIGPLWIVLPALAAVVFLIAFGLYALINRIYPPED
jgi:hypothetical protein